MDTPQTNHVIWFEDLTRNDVAKVGGKNASLGEMVRNLGGKGVSVPPGFATMAEAYWRYLDANELRDNIAMALRHLADGKSTLAEAGQAIRREILWGDWPEEIAASIRASYQELCRRSG